MRLHTSVAVAADIEVINLEFAFNFNIFFENGLVSHKQFAIYFEIAFNGFDGKEGITLDTQFVLETHRSFDQELLDDDGLVSPERPRNGFNVLAGEAGVVLAGGG